jgi:hypothetical protein
LLYLLSPSSVQSSQTINGILRFLWSPIIKETLLDMAQQSSKVLEVPASLVGNGNSFNDNAIVLLQRQYWILPWCRTTMLQEVLSNIHRCCSIRVRSIKPEQVWSFVQVPCSMTRAVLCFVVLQIRGSRLPRWIRLRHCSCTAFPPFHVDLVLTVRSPKS